MKSTIFKNCTPLEPRAIMAYDKYVNDFPNGQQLYSGKSRSKPYGFKGGYIYSIYETKTQVVVRKL